MSTSFQHLNHASILVTYKEENLLTDPWYASPAFGSWLPVPPLSIHPVYIASLRNLSVLISHGHDDHIDDKFFSIFPKDINVVTSDFSSPGVKNRIKRIGFENVHEASIHGFKIGSFLIKSYRNEQISLDDAVYTIRTPDALIIHCNDYWPLFSDFIKSEIEKDVKEVGPENVVLLSQTNSASGHPLAYSNLSNEEKTSFLKDKVTKMLNSGLENCHRLNITKFVGYAGYSAPFVKDRMDFITNSIFPIPQWLKENRTSNFQEVKILDIVPGREFDFRDQTVRPAIFPQYNLEVVKENSLKFYEIYEYTNQCDTFNLDEVTDKKAFKESLITFLNHFNTFVIRKVEKDNFEASIIGKTLLIEVKDMNISCALKFGTGILDTLEHNKKIKVDSGVMNRVIKGTSWFENLYTGYNAEFERTPKNVYNRDIIMYICMFSYFYKNRILA